MKSTIKTMIPPLFILIFLSGFALAACSGPPSSNEGDAESTAIPAVNIDIGTVVEGRLVPDDFIWLAFPTSGEVAEVLVKEGDLVKAGDVLARLGDRELLESNITSAELELSLAEQDMLTNDIEVNAAELDLLSAQQDLEVLQENWPNDATAAQQALTEARQAVHDTERRLNILKSTASQADIDAARASVVLAEDALDKAKEDFEPYEGKSETNLTRAVFQGKLAEVQKAYDEAVRRLNAFSGTANEFDISQAEANFVIAQARLDQAQQDYDELIEGPDPDTVALIQASINMAESSLSAARGRRAAIESRVKAAQAAITAAQAALDNLELVATIDGTVVELDLIAGERVSPEVTVVLIADFSQWFVETEDLTEMEVVDITVGQPVNVTFDALPDLELTGRVDKISDFYEEKSGDITYTTRILLENSEPRLRWGMTVVVTFEFD